MNQEMGLIRIFRRLRKSWRSYKRTYLENREIRRFVGSRFQRKVFVVGSPNHGNIGDSAILLAEVSFLKKCGYSEKDIREISFDEYFQMGQKYSKYIRRNRANTICWPGGGNLGDVWFPEELLRRRALSDFQNHRFIIFPQSIYYTNTEKGEAEKKASIPLYTGRPNLKIVARETVSYKMLRELYPATEILLTPDIVLSSSMHEYGVVQQKRSGVMLCVRNDEEKKLDDSVWDDLEAFISDMGFEINKTDMFSNRVIEKEKRFGYVREKMQEFCAAKLVITDRLHGMIFAALTGTPCVVFSNCNHKIQSSYEWIRYLPYIYYAETVDCAKEKIPELLKMQENEFDNAPLIPYFEALKQMILSNTR